MKKKIEILPTVVPDSLNDIVAAAERYSSFSSALHIDAGDGVFVQNKTWVPSEGDSIPNADSFFYEAHLMVESPRELGLAFIRAGCKRVTAHVEAFERDAAHGALDLWKQNGAEAGLAILLDTPLEVILPLVPSCDVILCMSIRTLGKQGASYDAAVIPRIADIHRQFPDIVIAVDGGVSPSNIQNLMDAGATRFGVGSAISKASDSVVAYKDLLNLAESAQK